MASPRTSPMTNSANSSSPVGCGAKPKPNTDYHSKDYIMTFVPAARVSRIKISPTTAAAARVRELKAAGNDIVDMTIGEPDFDTPDHVKAAAHAAIDTGETKYTAVNGTPALRHAILADFNRRLGLEYTQNEVCVAAAPNQTLFLPL